MNRADRRYKSKVKQKKRASNWRAWDWKVEEIGKFNKCHYGCGCPLCKPWKHKWDKKYKVSERRRLQTEENDG